MVCVTAGEGQRRSLHVMPHRRHISAGRPALRRALGEAEPTSYERGLLDGLRARLEKKTASEMSPGAKEPFASQRLGVEAIFSALLLA
jgi:hypothetical protein